MRLRRLHADRRPVDLETARRLQRGVEFLPLPVLDVATGRLAGLDIGPDGSEPIRTLLDSAPDDELVELNAGLARQSIRLLAARTPRPHPTLPFVVVALDHRFVADESFLPAIKDSVRAGGLEAGQLLLSLDGNPNLTAAWTNVQRLRCHGVRVAIEGVIPRSVAAELLPRYPFDVVRIDGADPVALDELEAILALARTLSCQVMVDGVETVELARRVQRIGCDLGVGPALSMGAVGVAYPRSA